MKNVISEKMIYQNRRTVQRYFSADKSTTEIKLKIIHAHLQVFYQNPYFCLL